MKLTVAVAQYDVPDDSGAEVTKLDSIAGEAADRNVDLLVIPETALGMLADTRKGIGEPLGHLSSVAAKHHLAIATSFYAKDNDKFFNQGYIVDSNGKMIHSHRKIYLAPPERDQDHISPGDSLTVSKTTLGNLGMLICKDGFNRYSHHLYQQLGELGADIICCPTWSLTWGELNTEEYIKSSFIYGAFLSRSFVLVSGNLNQPTKSFGRSLIISPIRGVLQEGTRDQEQLLVESIDLAEVAKARQFDSWWQPPNHFP